LSYGAAKRKQANEGRNKQKIGAKQTKIETNKYKTEEHRRRQQTCKIRKAQTKKVERKEQTKKWKEKGKERKKEQRRKIRKREKKENEEIEIKEKLYVCIILVLTENPPPSLSRSIERAACIWTGLFYTSFFFFLCVSVVSDSLLQYRRPVRY
jgi:cation transport ATPase